MQIKNALFEDLSDILKLQYLAYQSEARLLNNNNIPPLKQTLHEVEQEYASGPFLKAVYEQNHIIGSIRGSVQNDTIHIGKLIVHPDYQGQGIGKLLLKEMEVLFPQKRMELFTSTLSAKNI